MDPNPLYFDPDPEICPNLDPNPSLFKHLPVPVYDQFYKNVTNILLQKESSELRCLSVSLYLVLLIFWIRIRIRSHNREI